MSPVLQVQNLSQNYGGVQALKAVNFELKVGQCVAMIGPNGAGKSTCFACLAGQQKPAEGEIRWRGKVLANLPPHVRKQGVVARTFQVAQVFEALTVLQNLQLVLKASVGVSVFDSLDRCFVKEAHEWADKMALNEGGSKTLDAPASDLSYGGKKRLELAMAMAGLPDAQAGLLLLDEPTAGLSPSERADMMLRVKALALQGTTVLYTEHNMDAVFGVADWVLVLIGGQLVAQGLPHEVAAHPLVREKYLGQSFVFNQGAPYA